MSICLRARDELPEELPQKNAKGKTGRLSSVQTLALLIYGLFAPRDSLSVTPFCGR
jgi:hypothetical protein